jgi:hypothetical protein
VPFSWSFTISSWPLLKRLNIRTFYFCVQSTVFGSSQQPKTNIAHFWSVHFVSRQDGFILA